MRIKYKTGLFSRWPVPAAFANIFLIWGATYLAISYGLKGFPPFILTGLRLFIAGLILFLWKHLSGERSHSLSGWRKNSITGTLILTGVVLTDTPGIKVRARLRKTKKQALGFAQYFLPFFSTQSINKQILSLTGNALYKEELFTVST
jgi:drug/metabolite transporter (DMT)-like permease